MFTARKQVKWLTSQFYRFLQYQLRLRLVVDRIERSLPQKASLFSVQSCQTDLSCLSSKVANLETRITELERGVRKLQASHKKRKR